MKHLIFISIALLLTTTGVQAATINVGNIENIYVADKLNSSSNLASCEDSQTAANCDFEQTFLSGTYLSNTALNDIVTSDFRTSVKNPENNNAFINLSFTDNIVNGAGNDLVLFFVGNTTTFNLQAFDTEGGLINNSDYTIATPTFDPIANLVLDPGDTVFNSNGIDWLCVNGTGTTCTGGYALSAIFIDFGESLEGTAIGSLQLTLENSNFSLAGGFHEQTAVVPLPLSAVLFSSGLALLGWFGRRKTV